jgi:hypothetical protein
VLIRVKVELLLDVEADSTKQVLHTLRIHPKRAAKFSMLDGKRVKLQGASVLSTSVESITAGEEECSGY